MVDKTNAEGDTQVTKRSVQPKDLKAMSDYITQELETRKRDKFRRAHEEVWTRIDAQIAMQSPAVTRDSADWANAIQMGDMADALEIIAADVTRLAFPGDRGWFSPHIDMDDVKGTLAGTGDPDERAREQRVADQVLRAFMVQQHADFGLRRRVKLSVKEALSHGGAVIETDWQELSKFSDGGGINTIAAPVWIPHSMWSCYPDPSSHIVGTEIFYQGTMIVEEWMPRNKVLAMKGWKNLDMIPAKSAKGMQDRRKKQEKDNVQVIKYFGDINISREKGPNVYIPNQKVILCNGQWVLVEPYKLNRSPILYIGYERDDVRDPYYTSPLIKRSPSAAMETKLANDFLDAIDLRTRPPLVYNTLDPSFAKELPEIAPGEAYGARGGAEIKPLVDVDPSWALNGYQVMREHVQEGTGTDAVRKGVSPGTEQTATEVQKVDQKSEIRTVDFLADLEAGALKPFLYMQHDLNRTMLHPYTFYNPELHTPDFITFDRGDMPKSVHFEITGSRSVLGEEARSAHFVNAVQLAASIPQVGERTDWEEVAQDVWAETRKKDPERFVIREQEGNPELAAAQQEFEQQLGEMLQKVKQAEDKLAKSDLDLHGARAETQEQQRDNNVLEERLRVQNEKTSAKDELVSLKEQIDKANADHEKLVMQAKLDREGAAEKEKTDTTSTVTQGLSEITSTIQAIQKDLEQAQKEKERIERIVVRELDKAEGNDNLVKEIQSGDTEA